MDQGFIKIKNQKLLKAGFFEFKVYLLVFWEWSHFIVFYQLFNQVDLSEHVFRHFLVLWILERTFRKQRLLHFMIWPAFFVCARIPLWTPLWTAFKCFSVSFIDASWFAVGLILVSRCHAFQFDHRRLWIDCLALLVFCKLFWFSFILFLNYLLNFVFHNYLRQIILGHHTFASFERFFLVFDLLNWIPVFKFGDQALSISHLIGRTYVLNDFLNGVGHRGLHFNIFL